MRFVDRCVLSSGVSIAALLMMHGVTFAQTNLPQVTVSPPKHVAAKPAPPKRTAARRPPPSAVAKARPVVPTSPRIRQAGSRTPTPPSTPAPTPPLTPAQQLAAKTTTLDKARANILPRDGANSYDKGQAAIAALPQGDNTPIDKVLLQTPGFSQDSAASGSLHVRNEHANVQYRINGILLPDGVSGFGQFLDSGLIGNIAVIDGALPAEYGLHTSAIVDITTKSGAFDGGGSVSLYGGSRQTITPSFEYGGTIGDTEYFFTGRYFGSSEGIENAAPTLNAIHDQTDQGKFFGYVSTLLGDGGRLSFITGTAVGNYQIPNVAGMAPSFTVPGVSSFDSSQINEHQFEQSYYNVAAFQQTVGNVDYQISAFSRYSSLNFIPDPIGDLVFNGVASTVSRSSFLNGLQGDAAVRLNDAQTLRFGFTGSGEQAQTSNSSIVFPVDANGNVDGPPFTAPTDSTSKTGWLLGVYAQDEWKITQQLTLNTGVRFDQMYQYVDANQLSPRISLTYKPFADTTFHAGYARYFTPPEMALSAPVNFAEFNGTTQQAAVPLDDPVEPERSNVFDAGVDQKFGSHLTAGLDGYYKLATDLIDDGQFGQANTLTAFNYAKGWNEGIEGKADYKNGNFEAYGNLSWGHQYATQFVSNQILIDAATYAYAETHYIPTDHSQTWTGSAGASYLWNGTRFSADMIYGSGLRSGFANLETVPAYTQVNVGLSHEFKWSPNEKPLTVRFDVVNLFDSIYEIRSGTGIGVFAPQYGPRRGFYLGISQAL
jgi:outer membrane receptor protein involved in Fe transport